MEINAIEMLTRTTASFFAILLLARLIGKKQLSQLTFFHYITGITIGSIAAEISAQTETPFFDGLIALIWWSLLTIIISLISMKSIKLRTLFDDKPTIIIENGHINMQNIKKCRLNFDELGMLLREQSIFDFREVQFAVFEPNGQLSVLKYPAYENASKQDVKVSLDEKKLPVTVVAQGQIIYPNLFENGLSEEWLLKKCKRKSKTELANIDFAQIQSDGSLYVSVKKDVNQPS